MNIATIDQDCPEPRWKQPSSPGRTYGRGKMTSTPVRQTVIAWLLARIDPDLTVARRSGLEQLRSNAEAGRDEALRLQRRLGRVQRRLTRLTDAASDERSDADGRVRRTTQTIRKNRARATLVDELVAGTDLPEAMVKTARTMLDSGERYSTLLALAEAARTGGVGRGVAGVIEALAASAGTKPRAARVVQESSVADEVFVRQWALPQVVRAALAMGRTDVTTQLLADLSATPSRDLVTLAEMLLGYGSWRALLHVDEVLTHRDLTSGQAARLSQVRAWTAVRARYEHREPSVSRVVAIRAPIDPDASHPVQKGDLVAYRTQQAVVGAVRDLAVHRIPGALYSADPPPAGAWSFVSGAWVGASFGRSAAPIPFSGSTAIVAGWRPGPVQALTSDVMKALSEAAPIGCADWSGVDLLLGSGIPAFFSGPVSGCGGWDPRAGDGGGATAQDQEPSRWPVDTDFASETRELSAEVSASAASDEPSEASDAELAAWMTALGLSVGGGPPSPGDPTWDGLSDIGVHPREHLQRGVELRAVLTKTLTAVRDGTPARQVRRLWTESWESQVAQARARFQAELNEVPPMFDLPGAVSLLKQGRRDYGPASDRAGEIHVSLASDTGLLEQVPVALEGLTSHTHRPLSVWFLQRGFDDGYMEWLSHAFPDVRFRFIPCDAVTYRNAHLLGHITQSTIDRLLLPDLVDEVDQIIYLDVDALVCDDIAPLADLDLKGRALAARPEPSYAGMSLYSTALGASRRLPMPQASELRRAVFRRHPHDVPGFNAGVLVLGLDRLRDVGFCERHLGWVGRYRLHDQAVLLFAAGDDRVDLPDRWNMWPAKETIKDPGIVHWIGPRKPWTVRTLPESWRWHESRSSLIARVGPPPQQSVSSGHMNHNQSDAGE